MDQYLFQFCQKIVVVSSDFKQILLCKRKGERDYEGIFSFVGGKMENTDESIVAGMKREKDEEVGSDFLIKLYPSICTNTLFRKNDGNVMILPHYLAVYQSGEINLNPEEYSEYQWVNITEIQQFEPKIPTIPGVIDLFLELRDKLDKIESVVI